MNRPVQPKTFPAAQRGGFVIGLVVGLLVGLAAALGVALYVTKAPIPFVNKVPARPAGQDAAEAERAKNWDPNSALATNRAPGSAGPASAAGADTTTPATAAANTPPVAPALVPPRVIDPQIAAPRTPGSDGSTSTAALTPGAPATRGASAPTGPNPGAPVMPTAAGDPFTYFVQAGAFARSEDAEQQRARLAMIGVESRLTEREQGGRTVWRVRVGPFEKKEDADAAKEKLAGGGVDAALVRVQK